MPEPFDPYRKWLGIPPKDQPPDHYRLLGVERFEDDPDAISNAADRQMAHVRTFQTGQHSAVSQRILNEIAAARVCLLNADKKASYDRQLRERLLVAARPQPVPPLPTSTPAPVPTEPPLPSAAAGAGFQVSTRRYSRRRQNSPWLVTVSVVGFLAVAAGVTYGIMSGGNTPVAGEAGQSAGGGGQDAGVAINAPRQTVEHGPAGRDAAHAPGRNASPRLSRGANVVDRRTGPGTARPANSEPRQPANPQVAAANTTQPPPQPRGSTARPPSQPELRNGPVDSNPAAERRTLPNPDAKRDVPSTEALAEAQRSVREVFAPEFQGAKTPDTRLALAKTLFEKGTATDDDPAARYVLLVEARNLAAEAGDAKAALEAVDRLSKWYEVEPLALKFEALAKAEEAPAAPPVKQALAEAALELAEDFMAIDKFADASRTLSIAQSAARGARDGPLSRQIADRKRDTERIERAYAAVRDQFARLESDAADAEAHLAVGKFLSLVKDDWERGLPHLAQAADAELKAAAEQDLAQLKLGGTARAEEMRKAGDQWWDLALKERGLGRDPMRRRAAFWYRRAVTRLSGFAKEALEKRLAQVTTKDPASAVKVVYLSEQPELNVKVHRNWFGKGRNVTRTRPIKINGVESPHGLFMHPDSRTFASVSYELGKKFRLFEADVGVDDAAERNPESSLVFELWGDGNLLWRSSPIASKQYTEHCEAKLGRIKFIELRVVCAGRNSFAHAVWIEPRLTPK